MPLGGAVSTDEECPLRTRVSCGEDLGTCAYSAPLSEEDRDTSNTYSLDRPEAMRAVGRIRVRWDRFRAELLKRWWVVRDALHSARHTPEARRTLLRLVLHNLPLLVGLALACMLALCFLRFAYLVVLHAVFGALELGLEASLGALKSWKAASSENSTDAPLSSSPLPSPSVSPAAGGGPPASPAPPPVTPSVLRALRAVDLALASKCRVGTGSDAGNFVYDARVFRVATPVVFNFGTVDDAATALAEKRGAGTDPPTPIAEFEDDKGVAYLMEEEGALCAAAAARAKASLAPGRFEKLRAAAARGARRTEWHRDGDDGRVPEL